MKIKILISIALFCYLPVFSQTVINYQTWTGSSACNIFATPANVPATVNGVATTVSHQSVSGQPTYDVTNKAISLTCKTAGSLYYGTEYSLSYTFKANSSYIVTVNASCINSGAGTYANLRLQTNNGGSGTSNQCTGPTSLPNTTGGTSLVNGVNLADYQFNLGTISPSSLSFLNVAAVPPTNSGLQTILIRKITIVETAPAAAKFNISPASVAIACGSTIAQTFTVNNPSNITGVTGYTWNLGASNGWLYGGTAAPATFTTGTNSISLTPACGGTLKNVSATVSTTGSSYGPYTSTVSVAQTNYTINGDNSFCFTSNPYSVANLPCGSTVTWSAYPSSTVTLTPSGNTVTAKRNTYETFTLNATINNGCGTASKSVGGNKTSSYIPIYGPTSVSCDQTIRYHTSDIQGVSYQWSYPSSWSLISGQYTSSIGFQTPTYPYSTLSGYVTVSIHDVCSNVSSSVYVSSTCGSFVVSPNPATSTVTVSSPVTAAKERKGGRLITEVNLYDQSGNLKKRQKFSSVKTATLSLTNLKKGAYFIEIGDASSKERQQLIIQ